MTGTFLIIEVEQPEGISTRKLVIETAKHNVITAYNGKDGLELLKKFPAVDAVVVHSHIRDMPCEQLAHTVKQRNPALPLVVITPSHGYNCGSADRVISSHEPQQLLETLDELIKAA